MSRKLAEQRADLQEAHQNEIEKLAKATEILLAPMRECRRQGNRGGEKDHRAMMQHATIDQTLDSFDRMTDNKYDGLGSAFGSLRAR